MQVEKQSKLYMIMDGVEVDLADIVSISSIDNATNVGIYVVQFENAKISLSDKVCSRDALRKAWEQYLSTH